MSGRATRTVNRALLLAILVLAGLVLVILTRSPSVEQTPAPAQPAQSARSAQPAQPGSTVLVAPSSGPLLIPVAGVARAQLVDGFTFPRANGRIHQAIDIMAPRGTPVIAAAEGTVEKLYFSNGGGGITIYVRSPDQRLMYYYAHLDHYAPGLAEGQQVRRGAVIAFVGSTGDASPEAPHLHFAINAMATGDRWWEGTPVNPYPLLANPAVRP